MRAAFRRTGEARDRVEVTRDDGGFVRWDWPSAGTNPPHDLVHHVVEMSLGIADGFWGLIAAGAHPDDFVADDRASLRQAEAIAGALATAMVSPDISDADVVADIDRLAQMADVPVPEGLTEPRIRQLRLSVALASRRWAALSPGEAVVVEGTPGRTGQHPDAV
jgi:hypothetical protein